MSISMLESLACESCLSCCCADDESTDHLIASEPHLVAGPLESEHRVQHVDGHHDFALCRVGRSCGDERGHRAGFIDSSVQNLTLDALFVGKQLLTVNRNIILSGRVVNLGRREVRVHSEGASLVRNDGDETFPHVLVAKKVLEQSRECHRGRDFLFSASFFCQLVVLRIRQSDGRRDMAALGDCPTQFTTLVEQILNNRAVRSRVVIRRTIRIRFQFRIRNRNTKVVAERLEDVERQLLHLVNRVTAFEGLAESITLDGLRQNHRGLPLVGHSFGISRVQLAVVVPSALQSPDFIVGPIGNHRRGPRVASEEVFANVRTGLSLVRLEIAIGSGVHQVTQRAIGVVEKQRVPLATPDHLDDVPTSAAEERLEFLNNLAVTANRSIKALKVAVDDECQIVEPVIRCELQRTTRFDLVHFAVTEERPHVLVRTILDATVRHVLVELSLINRVDRTQAH